MVKETGVWASLGSHILGQNLATLWSQSQSWKCAWPLCAHSLAPTSENRLERHSSVPGLLDCQPSACQSRTFYRKAWIPSPQSQPCGLRHCLFTSKRISWCKLAESAHVSGRQIPMGISDLDTICLSFEASRAYSRGFLCLVVWLKQHLPLTS